MKRIFLIPFVFVLLFACEEATTPEVATDPTVVDGATETLLPEYDAEMTLPTAGTVIDSSFIVPNPTGWVNDGDYLFNEGDRNALDSLIDAHNKATGNTIYVVTIPNPDPYPSLEQYTVALSNAWNTSSDTSISSSIIAICVNSQEVKVMSIDSYDSNFSDDKSAEIIYGTMMPEFANGNFVHGIQKGVKETISYYNLILASRKEKEN